MNSPGRETDVPLGRRMKILHLDKKIPYPPRDGGSIATLNIARAFARLGHDVTILAMNTNKHFFDTANLPDEIACELKMHAVKVNTDINPVAALAALLKKRSYNVQRFISKGFDNRLRAILTQEGPFDVVQLEGLYLVPYIPAIRDVSDAIVSLRAHNVEHTIWERRAEHTSSFVKRYYLNHLARRLREYEIRALDLVDAIVPISPIDERAFVDFGCRRPMHMCPASFSEDTVRPNGATPPQHSICFLGALDWGPNREGLDWFMKKVWPAVLKRFPDLVIHIAGRNMPDAVNAWKSANVQIDGEVDDAYEYMRRFNLMVVPLLSGSGMRVKIIEGMALGKVVVSTPVGIEGIDVRHGEQAVIAETPEDYARQIIACLEDEGLCRRISASGLQFAREHFGSLPTTRRLAGFYGEMLVAQQTKNSQ
ncbi:MAG: glycosyltransferase family 4 protein [Planctomycetaceae bacterium]